MANNNNSGPFPWLGFILVLVFVISFINVMVNSGANSSSVPSYSTPAVNTGSFEHRYATERFKQEGFSQRDSQQAADAVIKFMEAQEARKR